MTARHVNRLIEHLLLVPTSRVAAIEQGDLQWMGWDNATLIAASTHNWIVQLIAGLSKGMKAADYLIRTPEQQPEEITFPTIADFIAGGGEQKLFNLMS